MREPAIARLRAPEVAARLAAGAALILPAGSTESHGPAAPMGDYLLAEAIAQEIARSLQQAGDDALIAPPLAYGGADFFAGIPGAAAIEPETLAALLYDLLACFAAGGARRILILNGHGGNIGAIEAAQRRLREARGLIAPALHLWREAAALLPGLGVDPAAVGHGGAPVLAVARHLLPDLCGPDVTTAAAPRPVFGLPAAGLGAVAAGGLRFGVPMRLAEAAPEGLEASRTEGATAALGARLVAALVAAAVEMLRSLRPSAGGA
ncbi:MAG: creatininase family protein [Rhodovarius sp.]|nr:creatininase family protein [Rhodovarius sp.]